MEVVTGLFQYFWRAFVEGEPTRISPEDTEKQRESTPDATRALTRSLGLVAEEAVVGAYGNEMQVRFADEFLEVGVIRTIGQQIITCWLRPEPDEVSVVDEDIRRARCVRTVLEILVPSVQE